MKLQQLFEDANGVAIPVFRGLARPVQDGQTAVKFTVRQDRRPLEMSVPFSALFNYAFEEKFGIPNIRKTSVFSSTNKEIATNYTNGEGSLVQMVIPPNAVIYFNPQCSDSLFLEEDEGGQTLMELLQELADEWSEKNGGVDPEEFLQKMDDLGNYMSSTGTAYFQNLIQEGTGGDPKRAAFYSKQVQKCAKMVIRGYKQMAPDQFARTYTGKNKDIEVIVTGISSYLGQVVEIEADEAPTDS